jgi:helix-turn-helix resolvase-like protein
MTKPTQRSAISEHLRKCDRRSVFALGGIATGVCEVVHEFAWRLEVEKELICARTGEGPERAKARGVRFGRKPKLTEHQRREAIRRRDRDGEPIREIARTYNVSHSTISRLAP